MFVFEYTVLAFYVYCCMNLIQSIFSPVSLVCQPKSKMSATDRQICLCRLVAGLLGWMDGSSCLVGWLLGNAWLVGFLEKG